MCRRAQKSSYSTANGGHGFIHVMSMQDRQEEIAATLAQAHREAKIEPNRISDHIGREPVLLEAYLSHRPRHADGERFTLD